MTHKAQDVINLLNNQKIKYDVLEHNAVYTIDEMLKLNLPNTDAIAKNLFVRDDKKRNYYLLVVRKEKKVELKALKEQLSSRPLSFASESDLEEILKLGKGSVTPFGIINDEHRKVKVILDKSFRDTMIGVHPNVNTATVWLNTADLVYLLKQHGNAVEFAEI